MAQHAGCFTTQPQRHDAGLGQFPVSNSVCHLAVVDRNERIFSAFNHPVGWIPVRLFDVSSSRVSSSSIMSAKPVTNLATLLAPVHGESAPKMCLSPGHGLA